MFLFLLLTMWLLFNVCWTRVRRKFVLYHLDQYVLTYGQLLSLPNCYYFYCLVVCCLYFFYKKRHSLVLFQSLKWSGLNQKNLEHPLISCDLPYDLFKADKFRSKFF